MGQQNELTESEQQVVDRVGGYVISRLGRQDKLRCADCRSALVSTSQGILVQERQHAESMQLSSSSPSLTAFLLHCEHCFRRVTEQLHTDNIGQQLRRFIVRDAPRLQCCHPAAAAAAAILPLYLRVWLHHLCKLRTQNMRYVRQKLRQRNKLKILSVL